MHATWLVHTRAVTHSYLWHDVSIRVIRLERHVFVRVRHDSFIWVRRSHICGMTDSYVSHDPFIWVTWLMRDVFVRLRHAHSYMSQVEPCLWHDSIICVTSLPYDIFVRVWHLCVTYLYVCDMARSACETCGASNMTRSYESGRAMSVAWLNHMNHIPCVQHICMFVTGRIHVRHTELAVLVFELLKPNLYIYVYTSVYICMWMCIHIYVYMHTLSSFRDFNQIYIYMYIYMWYICIYIYVYVYTLICVRVYALVF